MAEGINAPFRSVLDDEFFDLFRPTTPEFDFLDDVSNSHTSFYDKLVADNMNSTAEEMQYDFDDLTQAPLCSYVTMNQFKEIRKGLCKDTFSLIHLNIRSLSKHFDELQLLLDNPNNPLFTVIGLTETWLSSCPKRSFSLEGYNVFVNNRPDRSGGGVALYVSSSFECIVCEKLSKMNDIVESLFVQINVPGSKNIVIGIIYRPPNSNNKDFFIISH